MAATILPNTMRNARPSKGSPEQTDRLKLTVRPNKTSTNTSQKTVTPIVNEVKSPLAFISRAMASTAAGDRSIMMEAMTVPRQIWQAPGMDVIHGIKLACATRYHTAVIKIKVKPHTRQVTHRMRLNSARISGM